MALPERLTLDGRVWRVKVVRGLEKREGAVGICDRETRLIRIEASQSAKDQRLTLIHEILHAVFPRDVVGDRTEERLVRKLEAPVHSAFRVRR